MSKKNDTPASLIEPPNGYADWLNLNQMADLFLTTKQNGGKHIRNVFAERDLASESVVKDFFTTAADGKQYSTKHYSLDVIGINSI